MLALSQPCQQLLAEGPLAAAPFPRPKRYHERRWNPTEPFGKLAGPWKAGLRAPCPYHGPMPLQAEAPSAWRQEAVSDEDSELYQSDDFRMW